MKFLFDSSNLFYYTSNHQVCIFGRFRLNYVRVIQKQSRIFWTAFLLNLHSCFFSSTFSSFKILLSVFHFNSCHVYSEKIAFKRFTQFAYISARSTSSIFFFVSQSSFYTSTNSLALFCHGIS
jgi:hypothetical protein